MRFSGRTAGKLVAGLALAAVLSAGLLLRARRPAAEVVGRATISSESEAIPVETPALAVAGGEVVAPAPAPSKSAGAESGTASAPPVALESADDSLPVDSSHRPGFSTAEERQVRRFAALTDRWTRPRAVSVEEAAEFAQELKKVPPTRRLECLRRALNLIPDANVALLAGVLTDRSQDVVTTETVFHDIVNRSEEVKEPILKEIARDKTHPCSSDAEWIFAVTGERPE